MKKIVLLLCLVFTFNVFSQTKVIGTKLKLKKVDYNKTSSSVLVHNEVLGSEIITNGGFDSDSNWNKNPKKYGDEKNGGYLYKFSCKKMIFL